MSSPCAQWDWSSLRVTVGSQGNALGAEEEGRSGIHDPGSAIGILSSRKGKLSAPMMKKKSKLVLRTVYLTIKMDNQLRRIARRRKISKGALIRELLEAELG